MIHNINDTSGDEIFLRIKFGKRKETNRNKKKNKKKETNMNNLKQTWII